MLTSKNSRLISFSNAKKINSFIFGIAENANLYKSYRYAIIFISYYVYSPRFITFSKAMGTDWRLSEQFILEKHKGICEKRIRNSANHSRRCFGELNTSGKSGAGNLWRSITLSSIVLFLFDHVYKYETGDVTIAGTYIPRLRLNTTISGLKESVIDYLKVP